MSCEALGQTFSDGAFATGSSIHRAHGRLSSPSSTPWARPTASISSPILPLDLTPLDAMHEESYERWRDSADCQEQPISRPPPRPDRCTAVSERSPWNRSVRPAGGLGGRRPSNRSPRSRAGRPRVLCHPRERQKGSASISGVDTPSKPNSSAYTASSVDSVDTPWTAVSILRSLTNELFWMSVLTTPVTRIYDVTATAGVSDASGAQTSSSSSDSMNSFARRTRIGTCSSMLGYVGSSLFPSRYRRKNISPIPPILNAVSVR